MGEGTLLLNCNSVTNLTPEQTIEATLGRDKRRHTLEPWHRMTNLRVEPASPCDRGRTCGECEHFAVAPHWHEKPWQGNADGVCDLDCTSDDIKWVREDDPACKDWER